MWCAAPLTRTCTSFACPAQEAIRQLQLCTTVDNEELQRLGVRLELDERSGKLRVTKRDGSNGGGGGGGGGGQAALPGPP